MIDTEALAIIEAALAHHLPLKDHKSGGRAAAFFDLDGTMSRGHMIFDFPAHLLGAGLFSLEKHREILDMNNDFKAGKLTYRKVAEELPHLYAEGVRGQQAGNIAIEAERFVEGRMDKVFPYAKGLVRLMRESGRPAIALSGSPVETVRALSRRLGMDAAFGTELEIEGGFFTGNISHNFILKETKSEFFEELVEKLGLDVARCFGFGDTEQDLSFLGRVGHPVALNAGGELRAQALKHGWPLFGEAQDVVGEVRKLLED